MTKWKKLRKGISYLEGDKYVALVYRWAKDDWSYDIYNGSIKDVWHFLPSNFTRRSECKAIAQMMATQLLMSYEAEGT
jgi:hypothetical protein